MNWKFPIGLALGFAIGLGCAAFGIPSPAPPVLAGAMLVVTMSTGYVVADRLLAGRAATQQDHCGGPRG